MISLSACVFVNNETVDIKPLLQSLDSWVDEIIVVDSIFSHRIQEACNKLSKVKYFPQSFQSSVDQKNYALSKATKEWHLNLELGEHVNEKLKSDIRNFIAHDLGKLGASVPVKFYFNKKLLRYGGWLRSEVRLSRRGHGLWVGGLQERLSLVNRDKILEKDCIQVLKTPLLHHTNRSASFNKNEILKLPEIFKSSWVARNKRYSRTRLLTQPLRSFFETFVLKRGFLEGIPGFFMALKKASRTFYQWAAFFQKK